MAAKIVLILALCWSSSASDNISSTLFEAIRKNNLALPPERATKRNRGITPSGFSRVWQIARVMAPSFLLKSPVHDSKLISVSGDSTRREICVYSSPLPFF